MAIRWPVGCVRARCFDRLADAGDRVNSESVQHNNISTRAQASQERGGFQVAKRCNIDQQLALEGPRRASRTMLVATHVSSAKIETIWVHVALPNMPILTVEGDVSPVLLGRSQALFLCQPEPVKRVPNP